MVFKRLFKRFRKSVKPEPKLGFRDERGNYREYTEAEIKKTEEWAGKRRRGEPDNYVMNERNNLEVIVHGMPVEVKKFDLKNDRALLDVFAARNMTPETTLSKLASGNSKVPEIVVKKLLQGEAEGVIGVADIGGGRKRIVSLYGYDVDHAKKKVFPGFMFVDKNFRDSDGKLGTITAAVRDAKYRGYTSTVRRENPATWKMFTDTLGYEDLHPWTDNRNLEVYATKKLENTDMGGKGIKRKRK